MDSLLWVAHSGLPLGALGQQGHKGNIAMALHTKASQCPPSANAPEGLTPLGPMDPATSEVVNNPQYGKMCQKDTHAYT